MTLASHTLACLYGNQKALYHHQNFPAFPLAPAMYNRHFGRITNFDSWNRFFLWFMGSQV